MFNNSKNNTMKNFYALILMVTVLLFSCNKESDYHSNAGSITIESILETNHFKNKINDLKDVLANDTLSNHEKNCKKYKLLEQIGTLFINQKGEQIISYDDFKEMLCNMGINTSTTQTSSKLKSNQDELVDETIVFGTYLHTHRIMLDMYRDLSTKHRAYFYDGMQLSLNSPILFEVFRIDPLPDFVYAITFIAINGPFFSKKDCEEYTRLVGYGYHVTLFQTRLNEVLERISFQPPNFPSYPNNPNNNNGSSTNQEIVTTPEFDNSRVKAVYDKFLSMNLMENCIHDFLGKDSDLSLIWSVRQCGSKNGQCDATQIENGIIIITIDSDYAKNATDIEIAKTLLHEALHANMFNELYKIDKYDNITFDDYPGLKDYYTRYVNPNGGELYRGAQHNIMATHCVDAMAECLQDFDNNVNFSYDHYLALSWKGLHGTKEYIEMLRQDPTAKDEINKLVNELKQNR